MAWLSAGIFLKNKNCHKQPDSLLFIGASNADFIHQLVSNGVIKDEKIREAFELTDRGNLLLAILLFYTTYCLI